MAGKKKKLEKKRTRFVSFLILMAFPTAVSQPASRWRGIKKGSVIHIVTYVCNWRFSRNAHKSLAKTELLHKVTSLDLLPLLTSCYLVVDAIEMRILVDKLKRASERNKTPTRNGTQKKKKSRKKKQTCMSLVSGSVR